MKDKITVIGSLNYDIILKISRLPVKWRNIAGKEAAYSAGWKRRKQAVQAAKLHTLTIYGWSVGTDAAADFLVSTAEAVWSKHRLYKKSSGKQRKGNYKCNCDGVYLLCIVRGANYEITKQDIDHAMPALKESKVCICKMKFL